MGKSIQEPSGADLRALGPGRFVTVRRIEHGGALQARALAGGVVQFYWRYTHNGKTDRLAIGTFDSSAPPKSLSPTSRGYSIAAAAEACRVFAMKHLEAKDEGGIRRQQELKRREHEAALHAEAEERRRQREADIANEQTFGRLLTRYVQHLQDSKRSSYSDVRSMFRLHVQGPWPDLWDRPAASIQMEDVANILRRLMSADKGRTANKLRSYLRASFQVALDEKGDYGVLNVAEGFHLPGNPVDRVKRKSEYDRKDKNPLSLAELRRYWQITNRLDGTPGRVLRVHLLTGGQRIEQLLRVSKSDISDFGIRLRDLKGKRPDGPRIHVVPLIDQALSDIEALVAAATEGPFVFSTTRGSKPASNMTMLNWAKAAVGDAIRGFTLKRIRSGVETALSGAGVSKDVRAQLQSHGIGGVQEASYDGHDYLREKRGALQLLHNLLVTESTPTAAMPD